MKRGRRVILGQIVGPTNVFEWASSAVMREHQAKRAQLYSLRQILLFSLSHKRRILTSSEQQQQLKNDSNSAISLPREEWQQIYIIDIIAIKKLSVKSPIESVLNWWTFTAAWDGSRINDTYLHTHVPVCHPVRFLIFARKNDRRTHAHEHTHTHTETIDTWAHTTHLGLSAQKNSFQRCFCWLNANSQALD